MTQENDVVTTPAPEVKQPEETVTPEVTPEPTISEVLVEKKEPDTIPKARLDKEIQKRKEAEQAVIDLQAKLAQGTMTKSEVSSDLKEIASKYDIDPSFVNELATAINAQAEARFEERLRPLTEKERQEKIDRAFRENFDRVMENMPDYKGIVNPQVIKTLSLDSANGNKTFRQLIEEAYGTALGGKRTIETTTPRGGNASGELDYDRAKRDEDYFKEIMKDPVLKKQYNDKLFGSA